MLRHAEVPIVLSDKAEMPIYSNYEDAGVDIKVLEEVYIMPGKKELLDSGIKVAIPSGTFLMVVPRSSTGKLDIRLANTVGVIDSPYRGSILMSLYNTGDSPILLMPGQRVCQMVLVPYIRMEFELVDELDSTSRGSGGFGSSGA